MNKNICYRINDFKNTQLKTANIQCFNFQWPNTQLKKNPTVICSSVIAIIWNTKLWKFKILSHNEGNIQISYNRQIFQKTHKRAT